MSNPALAGFGLRPIRMIDGSPLNFQARMMFHSASDSVALYVGDLVIAGTQTSTNNQMYLPTVAQYVPADANCIGVVIAVDPIIAYQGNLVGQENLIRQYCPASTAGYVYICNDARVVFQIVYNGTLGIADVNQGFNAEITATPVGNTSTGLSGMSATGAATTSTLPMRIIGFSQLVGNDPSSANPQIDVILNTVQPERL